MGADPGQNMGGECYAFVSDAHPSRDIQNVSLLKGAFSASGANRPFTEGSCDFGSEAGKEETSRQNHL